MPATELAAVVDSWPPLLFFLIWPPLLIALLRALHWLAKGYLCGTAGCWVWGEFNIRKWMAPAKIDVLRPAFDQTEFNPSDP